jgi:hypothetical protein
MRHPQSWGEQRGSRDGFLRQVLRFTITGIGEKGQRPADPLAKQIGWEPAVQARDSVIPLLVLRAPLQTYENPVGLLSDRALD